MKMDNYELLRLNIQDIEYYVQEVIDYLDNQEFYDNCEDYFQDEVKAYFKTVPETIKYIYKLINKIERKNIKENKQYVKRT